MNFSIKESMDIITGLDRSIVQMKELVSYIGHQRKQKQYNDYTGVAFKATYKPITEYGKDVINPLVLRGLLRF